MTSREMVRSSLAHQETGRVPVDFGSTSVTGMHVAIVAALREHYGLEKRPVKVHEPYQMLGLLEEDLQKVIGIDVEGISPYETLFGFRNEDWKQWKLPNGPEVLVPGDFRTIKDANDNTLIFPAGDTSVPPSGRMPKNGYFFDSIIRQEPIDEHRLNVEDNLEEFGPVTDQVIEYFRLEALRAKATGRGVIANFGGTALGDIALVPASFLKHPRGIRDIEEWYLSTLTRQDYIHQIFDRQSLIAVENLKKIRPAVGNAVDVVFICGTDFGTQTSQFCSVDTFRSLYMPYYKRLNDWIHANTSWKTFKHSCGAVEPLIESLIEAGFDILNPVQCSAAGMDPVSLKKTYGERIVFWGGGVDTQKTLPFGKPAEVREEVLRRCEIFSGNGGFIFNTIHNIQGNTPVENVIAMIEALKEFNGQA
ncbi:methyltransferase [bacterium]|nr:methyltransferase [bacterium]